MTRTTDPERFRDRWNEHVDELSRLWHTLPDEKVSELKEAQDELRELVDAAAENLEDEQ